jgi:hypothetical protein
MAMRSWVEGKRHFRSLIRDAKDPQRMFNYWRTTTTELVALAPKAPYHRQEGHIQDRRGEMGVGQRTSHRRIWNTTTKCRSASRLRAWAGRGPAGGAERFRRHEIHHGHL